jgi:hypothetical protein
MHAAPQTAKPTKSPKPAKSPQTAKPTQSPPPAKRQKTTTEYQGSGASSGESTMPSCSLFMYPFDSPPLSLLVLHCSVDDEQAG